MKENLETKLESIKQKAFDDIKKANSLATLTEVRNAFLSKKSELNSMMQLFDGMSPEERKTFGQIINDVRNSIVSMLNEKMRECAEAEINEKLKRETIDISLPGIKREIGHENPLLVVQDEIVDIFIKMGYTVKEGGDVELDHYNFELMNIPKDHPSRDMQDSFYINEKTLLRTHTSPAQARAMEEAKGEPIRIICPGKCYRRDDDDMTHSHQFSQIEGLVVDKNINIGNLEATLSLFIKHMFGEKREIRLRSSYFPFTEPSVEVDVTCAECNGEGCPLCKGTGYIEILGAGMVHPNVLKMNGYDPEKYTGFAFGIGLERVAMLRYGIDDIRRFYQNDMRFINQFKRGE
ncbi:MAG: phenylalanine--tRNA ligase subunit alpha [Bacilli bacterium]|jgi:phenylalanyl-tRNA synthetase alpha chain